MSTLTHTVLVTGGTLGLGYQTALDIARQQPDYLVLIASRSDHDFSATSINKSLGQKNVVYVPLDLADLSNVRKFVANYSDQKYPPIAALVLNAALQFSGDVSYTNDGIEKTFAVNHVSHALLFYLLRPHLAAKARIVLTASGVHDPAQKTGLPDAKYVTAEGLAHPSAESRKENSGRQRYATSKLCNVMWMYALHRRLAKVGGKSWTVTALDPGLIPGTGLARDASWLIKFLWLYVLPYIIPVLRLLLSYNVHLQQESGLALARLAVGSDVEGTSGRYYEGLKPIDSSVDSYDEKKQEDLWSWTAQHVATDEVEAKSFGSML